MIPALLALAILTQDKIQWQDHLDEALRLARASGRPVLVHLTDKVRAQDDKEMPPSGGG